jgi:colicin import membrane protein
MSRENLEQGRNNPEQRRNNPDEEERRRQERVFLENNQRALRQMEIEEKKARNGWDEKWNNQAERRRKRAELAAKYEENAIELAKCLEEAEDVSSTRDADRKECYELYPVSNWQTFINYGLRGFDFAKRCFGGVCRRGSKKGGRTKRKRRRVKRKTKGRRLKRKTKRRRVKRKTKRRKKRKRTKKR